MNNPLDPIEKALAGEAQALEAKQVSWIKTNRKALIIGAALGFVLGFVFGHVL